jgi:predicted Fe-Mo cluster-binding NifX family protein
MKVAVSATGGSKAAKVETRFGRCAYFVIVDSETMKFTAFTNPSSNVPGGAGPAAAQEIHKHGAEVVLTGQVGPQAERALQAADIQIVPNVDGTVEEAVTTYLSTGA